MDEVRSVRTELTSARCHLWIRGVVQGVGFRLFAERAAAGLGLAGLARNRPDGRVEIMAEGPAAALEAFIAQMRRGPLGAAVDDVHIEWEPPRGLRGFRIQ
jgi:acylphosphatase